VFNRHVSSQRSAAAARRKHPPAALARKRPQKSAFGDTLGSFGPGIITGAADDDPSGIATYSQVGAQLGYGVLWSMLFCLPLMVAVQRTTAEIGRVTGRGVGHHLKKVLPLPIAAVLVASLGIANIINIGADAAAMGAAASMLIGGPQLVYAALFVVVCLGLQIFIPYERYASVLKWTTLSLFAYVATPLVVEVDWPRALAATVLPHGLLDAGQWTALTAVLGTTISPYLVFWQASQEAEDLAAKNLRPLRGGRRGASRELRRINADTVSGMAASNLIGFAIILTCAATLHAQGVTNVETPEQVAQALRPIAGPFAFALFALGIIGTGMLAIPVLAGATAYALAEIFGCRASLDAKWYHAKPFYAVIAGSALAGLAVAAAPVSPIRALYGAAVINGIAAVPAIVAMLWIAQSPRIMGTRFVVAGWRRWVGWFTAAVMFAAACGTIADVVGNLG
jgi:Mn2+/Fe2+ NRAMP family transporter